MRSMPSSSRTIWRDIRDCIPFADGTGKAGVARFHDRRRRATRWSMRCVWKQAVEALYDWQGGLIWLRIDGEPEAEAVRRLIRTSWRRARDAGARVARPSAPRSPVFEPQEAAARGVGGAAEGTVRSARYLQPGKRIRSDANQFFALPSLPIRMLRNPKRSCATACTAASAWRRAQPTSPWATSSIPPARPHLSDQGHAGERTAGRYRDRDTYRPLPLLASLA